MAAPLQEADSVGSPQAPQAAVVLERRVLGIRWQSSDEKNWTVISLDGKDAAAGEDPDEILTVGHTFRFIGHWTNHPKYGRQFAWSGILPGEGTDEKGLIRYLSQTARGIGEITAKRLWAAYGKDAARIIREDLDRIVADGLMSKDNAIVAQADLQAYAANEKTIIEITNLLGRRGFPKTVITECINRWGARAPQVIRADPYAMLLAGFRGCGFVRCDKLYLELGNDPLRLRRQALVAWHSVREQRDGNTWHLRSAIEETTRKTIISGTNETVRCPQLEPVRAVDLALRGKLLTQRIQEADAWLAETEKARNERDYNTHTRRLRSWNKEVGP